MWGYGKSDTRRHTEQKSGDLKTAREEVTRMAAKKKAKKKVAKKKKK